MVKVSYNLSTHYSYTQNACVYHATNVATYICFLHFIGPRKHQFASVTSYLALQSTPLYVATEGRMSIETGQRVIVLRQ